MEMGDRGRRGGGGGMGYGRGRDLAEKAGRIVLVL